MNPHPVDAACSERGEAVLILEPSELSFDCGAATVTVISAEASGHSL
jgi:hypothetical protein